MARDRREAVGCSDSRITWCVPAPSLSRGLLRGLVDGGWGECGRDGLAEVGRPTLDPSIRLGGLSASSG